MIIRIFALFLLFSSVEGQMPFQLGNPNIPHFIVITIPKSGTHLLTKCLEFLQSRSEKNITSSLGLKSWNNFDYPADMRSLDQSIDSFVRADQYLISHTDFSYPAARFLDRHPNTPLLLCIRDLRDVLVSQIYYSWKILERVLGPSTASEKLSFLLMNEDINLDPRLHVTYRHAEAAVNYLLHHPRTLVVRFEELVGSRGGGSDAAQLNLVEKIATALKINEKRSHFKILTNILFGDTAKDSPTFRSGQIGSWKEHFSEEQLQIFNEKFGPLQQALGYE